MKQSKSCIRHFSDLGIRDKLLEILKKQNFLVPTPIQHQVIPDALYGKDIVGIAQTGTGKTLAFIIPMIQRIIKSNGQGLILVPTRELAFQIEQVIRKISSPLRFYCAIVIGGASRYAQISSLKRNPHIVVATPGRLVDLINQRAYNLNQVDVIVLDEADRMLDIGFLPQIKKILEFAPKERQTMLFSATMPKTISSLAAMFMKMPIRIEIAPQGTLSENIEQEVFIVPKNNKMRLLDSILQKYHKDKILIFSRTKYGAKRIASDIRNMNYTATEIHSNRSQSQRKTALDGFVNGRFRVLVATDIASRGIDVKDISLVINFDFPSSSEDYVHRIGRTGRVNCYGKAISFVTSSERSDIKKIERLIRKSLPILSLPILPPERKKSYNNEEKFPRKRNQGSFRRYRNNSRRRRR
ncbi:DEAD/DEAH box helicase [Patescibacteria group bacterium]